MKNKNQIVDDPDQYGSKGQKWAPEFVAYMKAIVTHPVYENMPDAIKEDGKIQWEAPSNRSGGNYQFSHNKRRDWWKNKAESIGIDTSKDQWISRTAKKIHPTGEKPCKRCGTIMQIAYVYPQTNLIKRFSEVFGESFEISTLEPITDVIQRAIDLFGNKAIEALPKLLSTAEIKFPHFNDAESLIEWVQNIYIPREPSLLSPGAMSNAPDRFDGFHSFNRCCRGKADTGRHSTNLRSYTTDRRVFEFWSEGDWIAADRLMGLVKSALREEACADGGSGPATADHIGPLSLGFCHRPEFRLLSRAANSSKNNRMTKWDVEYLKNCENNGIKVVSWYAQPLWDMRKNDVDNDEKALRISKLLRDNQRNAMRLLCKIHEAKRYAFLTYLLELSYADKKIEFINLKAKDFLTCFDKISVVTRDTKYSAEQKARRIRIGFEALRTYKEKNNRHSFIVAEKVVDQQVKSALSHLDSIDKKLKEFDVEIGKILFPTDGIISEKKLRDFTKTFPVDKIDSFEHAKNVLSIAMNEVGKEISAMWNSDRYVREEFDL